MRNTNEGLGFRVLGFLTALLPLPGDDRADPDDAAQHDDDHDDDGGGADV